MPSRTLNRLALLGMALAIAGCSDLTRPGTPVFSARSGDEVTVDNPDFRTLKNDIAAIEGVNTRSLLASAEASEDAFARGNRCAALGALGALENKLIDNPNIVDDPNIRVVQADIAAIRVILTSPDTPGLPPGPCIDDPNIYVVANGLIKRPHPGFRVGPSCGRGLSARDLHTTP